MFTKENLEIGKHLDYLISQQYDSRREFGRQYLIARGNTDPSIEEVNRMSNRLAQIVYGRKAAVFCRNAECFLRAYLKRR